MKKSIFRVSRKNSVEKRKKLVSPMGFEPMPVSRRQLECRVLDRSTTVTDEE